MSFKLTLSPHPVPPKRRSGAAPAVEPARRPAKLRTVGKLADEMGVPVHRIEYVLKTRTSIVPAALAGRTRLYDRAAAQAVRLVLVQIADRSVARSVAGSKGVSRG